MMTAVLLNKIFMASLAGVIIATAACFYFASQFLSKTAIETARAKADIALITEDLQKLNRLEIEMQEKSEIVARAYQIVGESASFQHQNQIVQDVNTYARIAGVEVGGFSFASQSQAAASPTPPATGTIQTKVPGVKTLDATVTLKTPIRYDNFLMFLKAIEQNLTKMQVTGVNMTPSSDDPNMINNPTIGLQIYVKE